VEKKVFQGLSQEVFFHRMVWPSAALFVFLFFLVGVVAQSSEFQPLDEPGVVIPFWDAATKLYRDFFNQLFQMPEVCWTGNTVNDFQAVQCERFWGKFLKLSGLASVPGLGVGFFLWLGFDSIQALNRRIRKILELGKASFTGTATKPPQASADVFSWTYCLIPIMVQLPDQTQLKVYVSRDAALPRAGETLVAFDLGRVLGEKRYFGMVYTPHVAILSAED